MGQWSFWEAAHIGSLILMVKVGAALHAYACGTPLQRCREVFRRPCLNPWVLTVVGGAAGPPLGVGSACSCLSSREKGGTHEGVGTGCIAVASQRMGMQLPHVLSQHGTGNWSACGQCLCGVCVCFKALHSSVVTRDCNLQGHITRSLLTPT